VKLPEVVAKKEDFVPDENFSWNFDLNAAAGKNKSKQKEGDFTPFVIRSDGT
jgi:hypothetical protein